VLSRSASLDPAGQVFAIEQRDEAVFGVRRRSFRRQRGQKSGQHNDCNTFSHHALFRGGKSLQETKQPIVVGLYFNSQRLAAVYWFSSSPAKVTSSLDVGVFR